MPYACLHVSVITQLGLCLCLSVDDVLLICLAPEEVGRILLRAHLNRDDTRISCRLCLSVKVRTLSAKALSEQKQGR